MTWLAGKYLAFDLETTSKFPTEARVVTATTILIDPATGSKDVANCVPTIGHNLGYDFTVLDCEVRRYWPDAGGLTLHKAVLDTFVLDKHFDRYRKGKRQLVSTAAHYGIRLSEEDAHDATADALASARILWKMARKYPALAKMSLDELYDAQVAWYAEQATSLARYFASQGNHEHVPTEWPIRAVPSAVA